MAARAESVWTRPARPRREQQTLSRDQIVEAAIELLDAEGLAGLSMRRLGAKLNSGATTVYWHVANKDELLELALDRVVSEVTAHPAPDWRAGATRYARSMRATIVRHPWTVPLYGSRPMLGPNAGRCMDELLTALRGAGFRGFDLEYAQAALNDYVIGAAGSEASWRANQDGLTGADWMATLGAYLQDIGRSRPGLASHVREVWSRNDLDHLEERFAFGLGVVLDGLAARLP